MSDFLAVGWGGVVVVVVVVLKAKKGIENVSNTNYN
jgi:hypothetical protein